MRKPNTIRHARGAAADALSVTPSVRVRRMAPFGDRGDNVVGSKSRSRAKSLHAKVRDTAAVRSVPNETPGKTVPEVDLNRRVTQEVDRQLRQSGIAPFMADDGNAHVREAREYAHKVFGDAAKADRWLARPSLKLGSVRPIGLSGNSRGRQHRIRSVGRNYVQHSIITHDCLSSVFSRICVASPCAKR
ncbi:MAG: hypothetical protein CBCREVIR_0751 [Candidatus Burkholderia crenata]|nr:MAG: hypothetical protein CBCREVIR_0751 [Candidatus Burkholderia crenata]